MAKVSELKQQALALEEQGEIAKAVVIYRHLLTHLEGTPAIKEQLGLYLKVGDMILGMGDRYTAIDMYEKAGQHLAAAGSAQRVLTVAAKIQRAAPDRPDVYLSLGRSLFQHGHAGPAVEVLIEHAKLAALDQVLQELQPLAGLPSDEVRPRVAMILEGLSGGGGAAQASGVAEGTPALQTLPPLAPPPPPPPVPLAAAPIEPPAPLVAAPSAPPTPPLPPLAPAITPLSPVAPAADLGIERGTLVPPTTRESVAMEMHGLRARVTREDAEGERVKSRPARSSAAMRPSVGVHVPRRRPRALLWAVVPVIVAGVGAWLVVSGVLPIAGRSGGVPARASGDTGAAVRGGDSLASRPEVPLAPAPGRAAAGAVPPAPAHRLQAPPVAIRGLAVRSFDELPGSEGAFRVLQVQASGQPIILIGRPLADTVGEPAVGEVRMDSLHGDTASAMTNFEGYLIIARGVIAPASLRALLSQLVSMPQDD